MEQPESRPFRWFFRPSKLHHPGRAVSNWILLSSLALLLLALALPALASDALTLRLRYDHRCPLRSFCLIPLELAEPVDAPVLFFLELTSFYQNHKKFLSSVPRLQLMGKIPSPSYIRRTCFEARTYADFDVDDRGRFPRDKLANPCGLMAKFFPQDIFISLKALDPDSHQQVDRLNQQLKTTKPRKLLKKLLRKKRKETKEELIRIEQNEIADPYFATLFAKAATTDYWVDFDDGRFVNWMKSSSVSNFMKLWGRIGGDRVLQPGKYDLLIFNRLNANFFSSEKYVVMRARGVHIGSKPFWLFAGIWGTALFILAFFARKLL